VARCGRCGLWSKYPEGHPEKKYAGVCLWYQIRLDQDSVYESRECPDFFERVPGLAPIEHFNYKVKRDNLGDAYVQASRAKIIAYVGVVLSLIGLIFSML